MKKRLFGILTTLFGIGLSFCSADYFYLHNYLLLDSSVTQSNATYQSKTFSFENPLASDSNTVYRAIITMGSSCSQYSISVNGTAYGFGTNSSLNSCITNFFLLSGYNDIFLFYRATSSSTPYARLTIIDQDTFRQSFLYNSSSVVPSTCSSSSGSCPTCPTCTGSSNGTIGLLYNNNNSSATINCNGDNVIQVEGLGTFNPTNNVLTPYFNINYRDQDNQSLIESYSKSNLYLSGGLFKKTYTGDNEWILTDTIESSDSIFSGYIPDFDITGGINEIDTGNIFNNFAENSVKFTLSNIPSYIQYVIIIMILFFVLGFIKKFKRR